MSTIVLRSTKGSALTFAEGDANFTNLNNDKLENITNESIGDLSDVDLTGNANGYVLVYNSTSGNFEVQAPAAGGISNVVEDLSPQLGGNLDVNGYSITSASNGNIQINPDGTGNIQLNPVTGSIQLDYATWPTTDGTSNQVLKTDGVGNLSWTNPGISSVSADTNPSLGGNLDGSGNTVSNLVLKDYAETVYSLGSTDSPSIDVSNGNVQSVTITSGLALPAFTGASAGQSVTLLVSGSGSATGTGAYVFAGGAKTLTTSSVVSIFYDGTTYWASVATDFQA